MLYSQTGGVLEIEREVRAPLATTQIIRFAADTPCEGEIDHRSCRLEMRLLPHAAPTRASYVNRWKPSRFEAVGDMFFVPSDEAVFAREDAGLTSSIGLFFRPHNMCAWLGADILWTDPKLAACLHLQNPTLRALMLRLAEETQNPGFGSAVLIDLIAGQAVIELARTCDAIKTPSPSSGLPAWRLKLIDERLADLAAPPTLCELAALCKLSERQLARAFRASRGASIGDYVAQKRMETAKNLLANGNDIKTIAADMGFKSASSFTHAFRKATGETPGQYRMRVLNA